jgi:ribulose bisphosphate carboxylase small subunit
MAGISQYSLGYKKVEVPRHVRAARDAWSSSRSALTWIGRSGDDEMALIDERTKAQLRERLGKTLREPVELRLYRRPDTGRLILLGGLGCQTCDAAEELARTLVEAAPEKLRLTMIDASQEPSKEEVVSSLTLARAGEESRIIFQDLPAGYEFATLIDAIERASRKGDGLSAEVAKRLANLKGRG